jgi:hypothetical protein
MGVGGRLEITTNSDLSIYNISMAAAFLDLQAIFGDGSHEMDIV